MIRRNIAPVWSEMPLLRGGVGCTLFFLVWGDIKFEKTVYDRKSIFWKPFVNLLLSVLSKRIQGFGSLHVGTRLGASGRPFSRIFGRPPRKTLTSLLTALIWFRDDVRDGR